MSNVHAAIDNRLGRKREIKLTTDERVASGAKCRDCGKPATWYRRYVKRKFYECDEHHNSRGPEGLAKLLQF